MESLKEKTAKGLFWGAMNNGTVQVLNIVFGIFLGRLLTPADYGIVGVLTIFTLIAGNLQSSGFSQALVNLNPPTHRDYNSVFWFNVIASVSIYAVLFACAPLIAAFFHQPCLVSVSRFVFLGFVISSLGIVQNAYMIKNMMNREIAIISFIALLCSGITGIILALNGKAYWSLAWQQIVYITVMNIGRCYYTRWFPSLRIDFAPVRRMFPFSVKILVTSIINTLSGNILTFIFGRLFPIKDVGNYTQAYSWNTKANSFISGTLMQIAQPVLASIRGDSDRERRVFRKLLRFTAFLSFPVMLGFMLVAREFILLTIGERWTDSVPLLQVLCIGGAFVPFYALYQNLTISSGRSDIYMWGNIAQIVLLILLILIIHSQGMLVMVIAYSLFTILWLSVWQWVARRLIGLRLRDTLRDLLPFLLITASVMALTWLLTRAISNLWLLLFARVIIAAALYVAAMWLLRVEIFKECLRFVTNRGKVGF
ncbi:MAG: lipopolysaccharide biosynthesis protein [Prevotella sp.]|nr:lipopolysaccharide biosynthesis protein [Prevotella sp.]